MLPWCQTCATDHRLRNQNVTYTTRRRFRSDKPKLRIWECSCQSLRDGVARHTRRSRRCCGTPVPSAWTASKRRRSGIAAWTRWRLISPENQKNISNVNTKHSATNANEEEKDQGNKNVHVNSSFDWLIDWSIDWLIDWLVHWFIDWSIGPLIDWLIDPLIHWSIDWLIDWSIGPLIDWLIAYLVFEKFILQGFFASLALVSDVVKDFLVFCKVFCHHAHLIVVGGSGQSGDAVGEEFPAGGV